jgi:hypothetical protein
MSVLIDDLVKSIILNTKRQIGGRYYIAKPLSFYGLCEIKKRIKDAYSILIGKSRAYHFKQDELDMGENNK